MPTTTNGANLGFEGPLWAVADKLRGHMDPAKYKHVVFTPWRYVGLEDVEDR